MHQEVIFVPKASTDESHADHVEPPKDLSRKNSFTPYYELLKTISLDRDRQKAYSSIYEVSRMITETRPQYKSLENELVSIVKGEVKGNKANKEANVLESIIPNLLEAYEIAYLEGLHDMLSHLLITALQTLKEKLSKHFTDKVNQKILQFWTRVDSYHMSSYLGTFELSNIVNYEDMVPVIQNLLQAQFFEDAANFIAMFKLHKHFDTKNVITELARGKFFSAISYFVEDYPDLQIKAIKELIYQKNSSEAGDLVKKFKFDPNQFPSLIPNLEKASLRYHAKAAWFVVEEKFFDQPHILGYYVDSLLYKDKDLDIAISIASRHKLHKQKGMLAKNTLDKIAPYLQDPPIKPFKYLDNPLFKYDAFAPSEEIIGEAQPGTYIHLKDFGLDMGKDIEFIDDSESKAFDEAIKDLLSSEAVGLDSEFKFNLTKFDFQPTALLQLANRKKIYLIDALKLINSLKYNNFITELLSNPKIQKVGHTLSADLHKLRATRENDAPLKVQNEVDIAKIFRKLYPEQKKYGLAVLCDIYLKKPMSKYDQVSNWQNRPLRKAQMHYGGLDAFVVLVILDKLQEEIISKGEDVKKYLEDAVVEKKEPKEKIPRLKKGHKEAPSEEVKLDEDGTENTETQHKKSRRRPYQRKNNAKEKDDESHRKEQHENGLQSQQEEPEKAKHAKKKEDKNDNTAEGQITKVYIPKKNTTSVKVEETTEKKV